GARSSSEGPETPVRSRCRRADIFAQELHRPRTWTRKNADIVSPKAREWRSGSASHSSASESLYIVEYEGFARQSLSPGTHPGRDGWWLRKGASRCLLA